MGRMKEGLAGFFEDDYGAPYESKLLPGLRNYPYAPGFKEHGGTSEEAARAVTPRVRRCHEAILDVLRRRGRLTADEIAADLGMTVLYVRPRVAELRKLGRIRKVDGTRGRNASGMSAAKWEIVP
jgi:hypothetical protein